MRILTLGSCSAADVTREQVEVGTNVLLIIPLAAKKGGEACAGACTTTLAVAALARMFLLDGSEVDCFLPFSLFLFFFFVEVEDTLTLW